MPARTPPATSPRPAGLRGLAAAALLALAGPPTPARAAHPLGTDDTLTQGAGHAQLELTGFLARDRQPAAAGRPEAIEDSFETALAATLGLLEAVDAVVSLPLDGTRTEAGGVHQGSAAGVGDLGLALKWRVLEAAGTSLAVKPGLTLPTGSAARGLGTGRACGALVLAATQLAGPLALHLNLGYGLDRYALAEERLEHERGVWQASLAAQGDLGPGLTLVGDVALASSRLRATGRPGLSGLAGLVLAVDPRLDLDVGLRAGWIGAERSLALLGGLTARY